MIDLSTKDGVLRFCARQRDEMERVWTKRGRFESKSGLAYTGYAFNRHAVEPPFVQRPQGGFSLRRGRELERIEACPLNLPPATLWPGWMDGSNATEIFGQLVEAYCRAGRAVGVLTMSEAWMANVDEMPDTFEYGAVGRHPNRTEVLWMVLEHISIGTISWVGRITRNPTRLHPWQQSPVLKPSDCEGRLTNLIEWAS